VSSGSTVLVRGSSRLTPRNSSALERKHCAVAAHTVTGDLGALRKGSVGVKVPFAVSAYGTCQRVRVSLTSHEYDPKLANDFTSHKVCLKR
jgi:hypothetical protein